MFFDNPRENEIKGTVFNIEKYHIHDGEGIRTNVFLKGCNLWCQWCCNPESQRIRPQVAIHENLCKKCGYCCKGVCDHDAIHFDGSGSVVIDIEKCVACGKCVDQCPYDARELYGREMSVAEVMREVEKDNAYYAQSDGGVTITGGEPCMQAAFTRELIVAAKKRYIHTAIETAGAVQWEQLWKAAEFVDLILFDMKFTNQEQFATISSTALDIVKENLRRLRQNEKIVRLRCPIIPDKNDNKIHIENIVALAKETGIVEIDLLPFHQLGKYKYGSLKYKYILESLPELKKDDLAGYKEDMTAQGLRVTIGG